MRSGVTAHLSFCPMAGVVVERAEIHARDHTLFVEIPMWNAYDSPGRLVHLERGCGGGGSARRRRRRREPGRARRVLRRVRSVLRQPRGRAPAGAGARGRRASPWRWPRRCVRGRRSGDHDLGSGPANPADHACCAAAGLASRAVAQPVGTAGRVAHPRSRRRRRDAPPDDQPPRSRGWRVEACDMTGLVHHRRRRRVVADVQPRHRGHRLRVRPEGRLPVIYAGAPRRSSAATMRDAPGAWCFPTRPATPSSTAGAITPRRSTRPTTRCTRAARTWSIHAIGVDESNADRVFVAMQSRKPGTARQFAAGGDDRAGVGRSRRHVGVAGRNCRRSGCSRCGPPDAPTRRRTYSPRAASSIGSASEWRPAHAPSGVRFDSGSVGRDPASGTSLIYATAPLARDVVREIPTGGIYVSPGRRCDLARGERRIERGSSAAGSAPAKRGARRRARGRTLAR